MRFKELEAVVLKRDLSGSELRKGDLGTVVHVYEPDGIEVEFVTAPGRTLAVVTLTLADVRAVSDADLMSVRRRRHHAA
jgi:Domain of unknown function (DUF4926)